MSADVAAAPKEKKTTKEKKTPTKSKEMEEPKEMKKESKSKGTAKEGKDKDGASHSTRSTTSSRRTSTDKYREAINLIYKEVAIPEDLRKRVEKILPKAKVEKDKDAPKRALNPFLLWSRDKRAELKTDNKSTTSKELGDIWKDIKKNRPEVAQKYTDMAAKEKEMYEQKLVEYNKKKTEEGHPEKAIVPSKKKEKKNFENGEENPEDPNEIWSTKSSRFIKRDGKAGVLLLSELAKEGKEPKKMEVENEDEGTDEESEEEEE